MAKIKQETKIYIIASIAIIAISALGVIAYQAMAPEKEEIALEISDEELQAYAQPPEGFITENDINTSVLDSQNNNISGSSNTEPTEDAADEALESEDGNEEEQTEQNSENGEAEEDASNQSEQESETNIVQAQFVPFENEAYQRAREENKTILLYFYANWCPTCRAEILVVEDALKELDGEKVVGFRINYNDDQVDDTERKLAEENNVVYQHTKVIIKNGEVVEQSGYPWPDVATYTDALK